MELNCSGLEEFIFLTAASDNHFAELKVAVYNIRKNFSPNRTIVVYDIGLSAENQKEVCQQCAVESLSH